MKRELKDTFLPLFRWSVDAVTRHIPMKRELKGLSALSIWLKKPDVTRHIPMKRELKADDENRLGRLVASHKAYPDEKGTERFTFYC